MREDVVGTGPGCLNLCSISGLFSTRNRPPVPVFLARHVEYGILGGHGGQVKPFRGLSPALFLMLVMISNIDVQIQRGGDQWRVKSILDSKTRVSMSHDRSRCDAGRGQYGFAPIGCVHDSVPGNGSSRSSSSSSNNSRRKTCAGEPTTRKINAAS